ncbi:helix-turn-helix domain-containing protein [Paenibacillus gorillae]|uniref:helix-turn-helix domain-containing protein n=1 Tax=Paenibacillus gorillae TaxID=1243662 RepID=UPI0004B0512A|nr:AraC family transcriptional regulator [Paenibacillus gorillae]
MTQQEKLAQEFDRVPVNVLGVYKTPVAANGFYRGHEERPTTKCALLIILRGQAEFCFNGEETYLLSAGEGFFGGLNKRMTLRTGSQEMEYFLVHYMPSHHTPSDTLLLTEVSTFYAGLDSEVLDLLELLQSTATMPDMVGQLEKKSLFYRLVSKVLQASRSRESQDSYPMIHDAVTFIQEHYNEKLTLERLAKRYGMSGKYFSYLFHKYMGIAPIDHLIHYRMKRAEIMLCTTAAPIHEIAETVGYADANYFCRMFKKHMGFSPSEFRRTQSLL